MIFSANVIAMMAITQSVCSPDERSDIRAACRVARSRMSLRYTCPPKPAFAGEGGCGLLEPALPDEFLHQPGALGRLLDLQQVAGTFDVTIIVAVLSAERMVGRTGG